MNYLYIITSVLQASAETAASLANEVLQSTSSVLGKEVIDSPACVHDCMGGVGFGLVQIACSAFQAGANLTGWYALP